MHWDLAQDLCPFSFYCKILTKVTYSSKRLPSLIALHAFHRESEGTAIKIPELMQLNKGAARKFELGGGFATDPRCFQSADNANSPSYKIDQPIIHPLIFGTLLLQS